jgi:mannose-6-phosphate isomerase-like protein (cupin superfamily)
MIRKPAEMKTETRQKMRGGEGVVTVRHFFDKEDFAASVRLCAGLTLPPGAGIGMHQHVGEDEVYLVTRGVGLLDDGKVQTPIAKGDAVLTGRGESHAIRNTGLEDLELLAMIVCCPAAPAKP